MTMQSPILLAGALMLSVVMGSHEPTYAQAPKAPAAQRSDPFGGFGANSKDPIRIDANKLEVFDKDQKAIYSGDVVAVRGTTVTRSSVMTIFYDNKKSQEQKQASSGAVKSSTGDQPPQDGALRRIEFRGPVSVVNGTQTANANEMIYDAIAKTVTLKGNAVVTDGPNVQRGELMTYNTEASIATITNPSCAQPPCRVQGVFTPGSQDEDKKKQAPRTGQAPKN
jgi:lipopolysaccharide export system protein LptA